MNLGLIDYQQAYARQMEVLTEVRKGAPSVVMSCEHLPVITFGRMSKQEHLLVAEEELKEKGVAYTRVDRGGDLTLHAPGQLVLYPILDLTKYKKDLHWFLNQLEEITIITLKDFGLESERWNGKTGVYVNQRKMVSMGIGVKKWITYHGVGINVSTDLELFRLIKPCGLEVEMTTMKQELNRPVPVAEVRERWVKHFREVFT